MTIVSRTFFCLSCKTGPFTPEDVKNHGCPYPYNVVESVITCTKKPMGRFIDWLLKDIDFSLAFFGATVINVMVIKHLGFSFKQGLLEGFCLGFVLIRLFRDKK